MSAIRALPNYGVHAVFTDITAELKVLDDQETLTLNTCVSLQRLVNSSRI